MTICRTLGVTALLLFGVWPSRLHAQESARAERPQLCFRGRPAPACDHFAITEIGWYHPVVRSQARYDGLSGVPFVYPAVKQQSTVQVGGMVNRGARAALGGTLLFGLGTGGADFGLLGRYRRWLTPDAVALDLSAGLVQGTILVPIRDLTTSGEVEATGVTAEVALNAADYGAVVVRTDVLRARGVNNAALYGGVRLGSRPAIGGSVVVLIGFAFLLAALSNGDF